MSSPFKTITVEQAEQYLAELEIEPCEYCVAEIKKAKEFRLSFLFENQDGHFACDASKLEDRNETFRRYGV